MFASRLAPLLSLPSLPLSLLRPLSSLAPPPSADAAQTLASYSREVQSAITPAVAQHLWDRGYAVVERALSPSTCAAIRAEIERLRAIEGLAIKNSTHLVREKRGNVGAGGEGVGGEAQRELVLLEKKEIWELDLKHGAVSDSSPLAKGLQGDPTLRTMLSLFMPKLPLTESAVKLQVNEGRGGAFPVHYDSDPLLDSRRCTAIFYLNPPPWPPSAGGELRLYPFPLEARRDVRPEEGTLVLFSSCNMAHRVLPSAARRLCFTVWIHGPRPSYRGGRTSGRTSPPQSPPSPLPASPSPQDTAAYLSALWPGLVRPEVLKHAMRLIYQEEWEQSLIDSHPPGPPLEAALAAHRSEVDLIRTALSRYAPLIQEARGWAVAALGQPQSDTEPDSAARAAQSQRDGHGTPQGLERFEFLGFVGAASGAKPQWF